MATETVQRIEPARPEEATEALTDAIADLVAAATKLGQALHPRTAANLADLVRIANTYYSNLIEGHNTRPKDIERALAGDLHQDKERRNLQIEAAAHVRLQAEIDALARKGSSASRPRRIFCDGCTASSTRARPKTCCASVAPVANS